MIKSESQTSIPQPSKSVLIQAVSMQRKLIDEWIKWREGGLHKKPWASTYKELQLLYLNKYFQLYSTVDPKHVEEWLSGVSIKQGSKRRHMFSTISAFAEFLQYKGLLKKSELKRIRSLSPKSSKYDQLTPITIKREQLPTLLVAALTATLHTFQAVLNYALLVFLSESGLRVSEACSLLHDDLFWGDANSAPYILVRCGKGGKQRKVPFTKSAQFAVREHLNFHPSTRYQNVFLAFNPQHGFTPLNRSAVATRFRRIKEKTGIKFTAHTLRHFCITQWANNPKYSIVMVRDWAGHSSVLVTEHYIHNDVEAALKLACG